MSSFQGTLDGLVYEEYSKAAIEVFENAGKAITIDRKEKKKLARQQILAQNKKMLEEKVTSELDENEFVEVTFNARPTGFQYYISVVCSADYMMVPGMASFDVGLNILVYATNRKIMIYEIRGLRVITRAYIIDYGDITKFKAKTRKKHTTYFIKCTKDKYDSFRMANNWIAYIFMHNQLRLNVTSVDRENITKFLAKSIKIKK